MSSWHSYVSIFNIGHRALEPLLQHPMQIEEKVDGSQFSAGRFDGVLKCRSKGKELIVDAPEKMFAAGVAAMAELDLHDGWTYRGEFLGKPKHNTLTYSRIPKNHVIIFDINTEEATYLSYDEKAAEAARIGLEIVPLLGVTNHLDLEYFQELLTRESVLGGTTIEGVVLKPIGYDIFGQDKKCIMGKFVSEAFKEKHKVAWKEGNPGGNDILQNLIAQLKTEARWNKAVQHLRDAGELENAYTDIGKLMKALNSDVLKEEEVWIKEELFKWAWAKINRGINAGFPQWYKEELARAQLSGDNERESPNPPALAVGRFKMRRVEVLRKDKWRKIKSLTGIKAGETFRMFETDTDPEEAVVDEMDGTTEWIALENGKLGPDGIPGVLVNSLRHRETGTR